MHIATIQVAVADCADVAEASDAIHALMDTLITSGAELQGDWRYLSHPHQVICDPALEEPEEFFAQPLRRCGMCEMHYRASIGEICPNCESDETEGAL